MEKTFKSPEAASAQFEKLVKEKLAKGYVDAPEEVSESLDLNGPLTPMAFHTIRKRDDLNQNIGTFIGRRVIDFEPGKSLRTDGSVIYRIRIDWDSDLTAEEKLKQFLDSEAAPGAVGLVIGFWSGDDTDLTPEPLINLLIEYRERLPFLRAIYVGDVISEENEMSWIQQTDVTPLLTAFPGMELLRTRGSAGLEFHPVNHDKLRALAIETGGLDVSVLRSVLGCDFPALEHLEIWLGTEEYGGTCSVQDLQPLFSGRLFPNLKYLGLRNCDFVDDIAGVVVNSPILERLETLDLSLGVLTDVGGNALLEIPPASSLKRLDLHYNYLSEGLIRKLKALHLTVDASRPSNMDAEREWRFVAVGE